MCKDCDELKRRLDLIEAELAEIKTRCPCWLSRLRDREPTRLEVELNRIHKSKREGAK